MMKDEYTEILMPAIYHNYCCSYWTCCAVINYSVLKLNFSLKQALKQLSEKYKDQPTVKLTDFLTVHFKSHRRV